MHEFPDILIDAPGWLVIDKPAGLAVHPGPRTPHSLEDVLAAHSPKRPPPRAVHRLDRDTSGCLLLARKASALRSLARQFEEGSVRKEYLAIVANPPTADDGVVDAPLAKLSSRATGWRMEVSANGKPAQTEWRVLERRGALALVSFRPLTGRTHQIRVHCTRLAAGSAIVGDPVYGAPHAAGMMLHAHRLWFRDPQTNDEVRAEAPCPARFGTLGFGADAPAG